MNALRGHSDDLLRKRRGSSMILAQKVNVKDKEYHVLSPIVIDFAKRSISFNVEREIRDTEGQLYTITEHVVVYDGVELRERQGDNGKTVMYTEPISQFSDVWGSAKDNIVNLLKSCIEKNEQRKAQARGRTMASETQTKAQTKKGE